ncbi:MAG: hypothetical protein J6O13_15575 [Selenomonas sp.]|jgi:hypothetical protein|nr:hypothetical protein [Selenomonas sp.]
MDSMLEVGLSIASTCATAVIGYLMYRLKKHEERKEAEEAERHKKEIERANQQKKENEALRASLIALTRDRILQGYRYYRKQGGIDTQDLETMAKLYAAYHALGGNGTITAVYNKITALPIKED